MAFQTDFRKDSEKEPGSTAWKRTITWLININGCPRLMFLALAALGLYFSIAIWINHQQNLADDRSVKKLNGAILNNVDDVQFCHNQDRKEFIRLQCQQKWVPREMTYYTTNARLLIDDVRRVAFCMSPNVVSRYLVKAMTDTTPQGRTGVRSNKRDPKTMWTEFGLRMIPVEDVSNLTAYRKFLVVRHPFDVIASAYRNEISKDASNSSSSKMEATKKAIKPDYKQNPISFDEFVAAVLDESKAVRDWRPHAFRCGLCAIDYDYILRMENFAHDFQVFADVLGIDRSSPLRRDVLTQAQSENDDVPLQTLTQTNFVPKHLPEFGNLSADCVVALENFYRTELSLFGYSFEPINSHTLCEMGDTEDMMTSCC